MANKKRVLMLISDTGGGHRASANALDAMVQSMRPKGDVDVKIVDIWTEHSAFPHNFMAKGYPFLCKNPWMWRVLYYLSIPYEPVWALETRLRCGANFKKCIGEYSPDLVVSLHPLCQHLPLTVMNSLAKERGEAKRVPFATVCTDLGGAHPAWFVKQADLVVVPSDAVRRVAERRGVEQSRLRQYGLPVRRDFWRASESGARRREASAKQAASLGLIPGKKTVLVVGGGDGVGSLGPIVEETAKSLGRELPDAAQVVALCGKNAAVRKQLEEKKAAWPGVHVEVRGFTSQISSYMECADCLVTKAGPGTIAEAAIRALPAMLSSFLPGQEAGNVPFVVDHHFGEYSRKPKEIGRRVASWLQDEPKLSAMSAAAKEVAAPDATRLIARDLLEILDEQVAGK